MESNIVIFRYINTKTNMSKLYSEKINVHIGNKTDFESLLELDYKNISNKMFSIITNNNSFSISEVVLNEPIINESIIYTDKNHDNMINNMLDSFEKDIKDENLLPLVVSYENIPVWCLISRFEKWPNWEVLNIDWILISSEYKWKWLSKYLLEKLIQIAKEKKLCRWIYAEMDTFKYPAIKSLLKSGFKFSWTKLFVYSKEIPTKYSKEAVYLYYYL